MADSSFSTPPETPDAPHAVRTPPRLYEIRTAHGGTYRAEADTFESGDGWLTLWADYRAGHLALRIPETDVRVLRAVDEAELESGQGLNCAETPGCDGDCCASTNIEKELKAASEVNKRLTADREEARQWARHGYEIGQRHCGWSDHGVAPAWLTDGWPPHIETCEHLQQMAEFDEALTRVRSLSTTPEIMNSEQERPDIWRHGYACGVRAARAATRPRHEPTVKP